ncbi:MAG: hypothetical protein AB7F35_23185 [Acetobacteraceae bacterium]
MKLSDACAILREPAYHDRALVRRAAIFLNALDHAMEPARETETARRMLHRIAEASAFRTRMVGA